LQGDILDFKGKIEHDDRKPLTRWLSAQQSYARLEADYLLSTPAHTLGASDRIRMMIWPAPLLVLVYTLFAKGLIMDGWYGWFYAFQRLLAETMIALELLDRRVRIARRN
jgi:hypothetical protein